MGIGNADEIINKNRVIAEYGALVCNYAQPPGTSIYEWNKTYIHFDHSHSITNLGHGFAHDDDCKPDNIGRFRFCYSPYYEAAVRALKAETAEELEENMLALKKRGDKLCLGRYVEQWFDVDEKEMIERYTQKCQEIFDILEALHENYMQLKRKTMDIRKKNPFNTDKMASDYKPQLDRKIDEEFKKLDTHFAAVNELSGTIFIIDENFVQPQSVLTGITSNLDDINAILTELTQNIHCYENSEKVESKISYIQSVIQGVEGKIRIAPVEFEKWKDAPYHFLTLDSYMVCRCGGILSFHRDGQAYHNVLDRITKATEDLINFVEQKCKEWYESYIVWELNYDIVPELQTERSKEIKNSKQAMEKAANLKNSIDVNPELKTVDDIYNGIHLEFWSHAYYDELKTQGVGLLSLVSALIDHGGNWLSMGIVVYQWHKEGDTDRYMTPIDIVDASNFFTPWINNESVLRSINFLSVITTIPAFLYTSNATWVEEIRITFFTDDYAVLASQKIDEDGFKVKEPEFEKMYKFDYLDRHESDGVKWKLNGEQGIKYEAYITNG